MRTSCLHLFGGVVCLIWGVSSDRRAVEVAGPTRVGFRRYLRGIPQMARENVEGGVKEPKRGSGRDELRG